MNPVAENIDLPDGDYKGYFYGWVLEINGKNYPTTYGVRCTKQGSGGIKEFIIKDNKAYIKEKIMEKRKFNENYKYYYRELMENTPVDKFGVNVKIGKAKNFPLNSESLKAITDFYYNEVQGRIEESRKRKVKEGYLDDNEITLRKGSKVVLRKVAYSGNKDDVYWNLRDEPQGKVIGYKETKNGIELTLDAIADGRPRPMTFNIPENYRFVYIDGERFEESREQIKENELEKYHWIAVSRDGARKREYILLGYSSERQAEKASDMIENLSDITLFSVDFYGYSDIAEVNNYFEEFGNILTIIQGAKKNDKDYFMKYFKHLSEKKNSTTRLIRKSLTEKSIYTTKMLNQYLGTALWASTDDEGEPLDNNFSINDFSRSSVKEAEKDIKEFLSIADKKLGDDWDREWDEETIGHCLWLSRNGHGAGFFDESLPFADELQDIARKMGEKYVFEIAGDLEIE